MSNAGFFYVQEIETNSLFAVNHLFVMLSAAKHLSVVA